MTTPPDGKTPSRGIDISKYQGRIVRSSAHNLTKPLGVARWFAQRCAEMAEEAGVGRLKEVNQQRMAKQLRSDFGTIPLADIVAALEAFLEDDAWLANPYPAWSQFYRQRVAYLERAEHVRLGESSEWERIAEDYDDD